MKGTMKLTITILFIISISSSYSQSVFGQEKVSITTGIGVPELWNVGICYLNKQTQTGVSVGFFPGGRDEKIISFSGNFYYHFGGTSKWTDRHPWYGRVGIDYTKDKNKSAAYQDVFLHVRIGRDFNISKKFGIEIDAGTMFHLYHKKEVLNNAGGWMDIKSPVLPAFGITFFYKI